ncbi:maltose alpha-D-glucosyltransferase [soil metagenome]
MCNHNSDQHEWFQRSRRARPGSSWREFYVWNDDPDRYREARIIFKDFETSNWSWDHVAGAYYWHRFYHHQPDLNFDHPPVRRAIFRAMDFWLRMGVDGLRLDAVPYLFEREGTNGENLPETHDYLKALRRHVDDNFQDRLLLAEANQWPEEAIAYFGSGDECQMAFHFPLMPRMFMAIRMEDRFPIIDILAQTPPIPDTAQWALFLRNHDELTLEMVTDEERDYMYRVYAHDPQMRINLGIRRRLAPLLGNNRRRVELMNGLLFSLPGTPVVYYGDEIGMGDNVYLGDRDGVRTPMQWSADRNAGFSRANPQRLYLPVIVDAEYHYEALNVEAQQNNPHSLLWWMKRLIALRKRYIAFSRGTLEFLHPENRKVLAFVRRCEDQSILVVANLSRFAQAVELDLSAYRGAMPVEMFGGVEFPPIGELPYFVTLGPHAFYWFSIEPSPEHGGPGPAWAQPGASLPRLSVSGRWAELLRAGRGPLAELLPTYLRHRRWYGGKTRRIRAAHFTEALPLAVSASGEQAFLTLVQVDYAEGDPDTYVLPLALATDEEADHLLRELPYAVLAAVEAKGVRGLIVDGSALPEVTSALLDTMGRRRRVRGRSGELVAWSGRGLRERATEGRLMPALGRAEQSNTSVIFGDQVIMKLFRRQEPGLNPDLEMGRFLTERSFPHAAPVIGALEYQRPRAEPMSLGALHAYVQNEGDAWGYTLDVVGRFLERALTSRLAADEVPRFDDRAAFHGGIELPEVAHELTEGYLGLAHLLGQRTGELHRTLASGTGPAFAPEPFSALYQRSLYQSQRTMTRRVLQALDTRLPQLGDESRAAAERVLGLEPALLERFGALLRTKITAQRIRCHGDYHLGQVLFTGKDFVIIDFEGEPALTLSERRSKRSALSDIAGMLRSFHYAAFATLLEPRAGVAFRAGDRGVLEPWADHWRRWVAGAFLQGYAEATAGADFLPATTQERDVLLDNHLLQKAVDELGYELNNRPTWETVPLRGILSIVGEQRA